MIFLIAPITEKQEKYINNLAELYVNDVVCL